MTPSTDTPAENTSIGRPPLWLPCVEIALVLAVFAIYAAWPVPDPNEPYYLSKARHYWDLEWIKNDFFLDTADSHWSFYVVSGALFRWLSFPAAAWTGRLITWTLLAVAWQRLSWALVPRAGAAVLSAALWVGLNERFQMAGEWVVGGFESKGLAYALVLAALAALVRGRWNLTWLLIGGASALHILVGGWAGLAIGICWLTTDRRQRPRLAEMLPGILAGFTLSLAGLVPALRLTMGTDRDLVRQANQLYVFERLPHHLSFFDIQPWYRIRFALLIVVWGAVARFMSTDAGGQRLRRVVSATVVAALFGIGLSLLPRAIAAESLRFYWFRLADVFVPLGVALALAAAAWRRRNDAQRGNVKLQLVLVAVAIWLLSPQIMARFTTTEPRADKRGKVANYQDWRDACEWIARGALSDAALGPNVQMVCPAQRSCDLEGHSARCRQHDQVARAFDGLVRHRRRRRTVVCFAGRRGGRATLGTRRPLRRAVRADRGRTGR